MNADFTHFGELYRYLSSTSSKEKFILDRRESAWEYVSKKTFLDNIHYLTLACVENGWQGKQVALAVSPSSKWLMLDYALMLSASVSVPVFTNISSKNLRFQFKDSGIAAAFIETEAQEKCIVNAGNKVEVIYLEKPEGKKSYRSFDDLIAQGKALDKVQPGLFGTLLEGIRAEDLATIVYTSGTSGDPKGVELSHANLISQVHATAENYFFEKHTDVAFSFLPLAHIFERMVMHFYISREVTIYFADDAKNAAALLKEVNPTVMTVVPRLLEKIYFKMKTKALEGNGLKKSLVEFAFHHASHKNPEKKSSLLDLFLDKVLYRKLRMVFGSNLRMLISGGAALSDRLYSFYLNTGIKVYQGYGLTESSPVIAANTPKNNKIDTCGKAFPGTEIKLSQEGELLARGPNVMRGYHNNAAATSQAIDPEGWLHTGDMAILDDEGYVQITGRKKELLKTSTGEYVSSVFIEQELMSNGWFEYVLAIGEAKPYVTALLFVEHEFLGCLAVKMKTTPLKALHSEKFHSMTQTFIEKLNKKLNHWEKVREYKIIADVLRIEDGFLTPSMKLAKKALMTAYKNEIDEMYKDHI